MCLFLLGINLGAELLVHSEGQDSCTNSQQCMNISFILHPYQHWHCVIFTLAILVDCKILNISVTL